MVHAPSLRAENLFRTDGAFFRNILRKRQNWIRKFGQIRRFRRPVVHLQIDVRRVVAGPWRLQLAIPYALQISGLRARTTTGDQQIAAEMVQHALFK